MFKSFKIESLIITNFDFLFLICLFYIFFLDLILKNFNKVLILINNYEFIIENKNKIK